VRVSTSEDARARTRRYRMIEGRMKKRNFAHPLVVLGPWQNSRNRRVEPGRTGRVFKTRGDVI
jgi:hypothetical protein